MYIWEPFYKLLIISWTFNRKFCAKNVLMKLSTTTMNNVLPSDSWPTQSHLTDQDTNAPNHRGDTVYVLYSQMFQAKWISANKRENLINSFDIFVHVEIPVPERNDICQEDNNKEGEWIFKIYISIKFHQSVFYCLINPLQHKPVHLYSPHSNHN